MADTVFINSSTNEGVKTKGFYTNSSGTPNATSNGIAVKTIKTLADRPSSWTGGYSIYVEDENRNYVNQSTTPSLVFVFADITQTSTNIQNFTPKVPFHAVDYGDVIKYSEKPDVISWGIPDYKSTLSGVGNSYTAPKEGVYWFSVANANTFLDIIITPNGGSDITYEKVYNSYGSDGGYQIHLGKGDKVKIGSGTVTMKSTYFIPLKGV